MIQKLLTQIVLWPTPRSSDVEMPKGAMGTTGVPAFNTVVLFTCCLTVTLAHWALKPNELHRLWGWLPATILLGASFVGLQGHEYFHSYRALSLPLHSGVYGSNFFLLTGFHGLHVTLGVVMLTVILTVILGRGSVLYGHIVDVVWLALFVCVYWW